MEFHGNLLVSGEGLVRFVYLLIVTIATIVGNLLVIVAVGKFKKLRRTTNIMLASLAVADLMVGLVTVPLYIAWTMHPIIFDHSAFLCRTALLSSLLVVAASQINLILLSVERYLAVCDPFRHRSLLNSCPWLHVAVICLTWVVSLTTTGLSYMAIKTDYIVCNYYEAFDKWFLFFAVIFGILIPFVGIIFMNIKVFLSVLKLEKRRKYFRPDYSGDSVRQVSDSSDQEIRVMLDIQTDTKRRRSSIFDWTFCCPFLKNKYAHDGGDDSAFVDPIKYSPINNEEDKTLNRSNLSSEIFSMAAKAENRNNDTCDDFCEVEFRKGSDHNCASTSEKQGLNVKSMSCEQLSESYPSGEDDKNSYNVFNSDDNACEKYNEPLNVRDLFIPRKFKSSQCINSFVDYNCNEGKRRETSPLQDYFSSSDNSPLLEPNDFQRRGCGGCNMSSSQLVPFHRTLYKRIETLATPRVFRKHANSNTVPKTPVNYSVAEAMNYLHTSASGKSSNATLNELNMVECQVRDLTKCGQEHVEVDRNEEEQNEFEYHPCDETTRSCIPLLAVASVDRAKSMTSLRALQPNTTSALRLKSSRDVGYCSSMNHMDTLIPLTSQLIFDLSVSHPKMSQSLDVDLSSAHDENITWNPPQQSENHISGKSEPKLNWPDNVVLTQTDSQMTTCPEIPTPSKMFQFRRMETDSLIRTPRLSVLSARLASRKVSSCRESGSTQVAYVSRKVARTVSLVCFSFIVAWLPFFSVIIIHTFCTTYNLVYVLNAVLMITFAQSAFNPIIYALCHVAFRTAYRSLFRQLCVKMRVLK